MKTRIKNIAPTTLAGLDCPAPFDSVPRQRSEIDLSRAKCDSNLTMELACTSESIAGWLDQVGGSMSERKQSGTKCVGSWEGLGPGT